MPEKLKKMLSKSILPYVELGIECYAEVLGKLRSDLLTRGFDAQSTKEIILALVNLPKRGR